MSEFPEAKTETAKPEGGKPVRRPRPGGAAAPEAKSQWPVLAALGLSVLALIVGILAYFQVFRGTSYSDDEVADAKADVCAAYQHARKSVNISTNIPNNAGAAAAVNARLAWFGGAEHLRGHLATHPATPKDLSDALSSLADKMELLGLSYLSENQPESQQLLNDYNGQHEQIDNLCAS